MAAQVKLVEKLLGQIVARKWGGSI